MSNNKEIHIGDIGTSFILNILDEDDNIVDISSATAIDVKFRRGDGTKMTKTGALFTDGKDGKIQYITISGDITCSGVWQVQARVVLPAGEWNSNVKVFSVHDNI